LEKTEKEHPDIIVTDLMMPVMDDIEMTKRLKSELDTCHIPLIILTSKSSPIEVGFSTAAYFAKKFKEEFGVTPSQFLNGE